jgi:hypothetical protein
MSLTALRQHIAAHDARLAALEAEVARLQDPGGVRLVGRPPRAPLPPLDDDAPPLARSGWWQWLRQTLGGVSS